MYKFKWAFKIAHTLNRLEMLSCNVCVYYANSIHTWKFKQINKTEYNAKTLIALAMIQLVVYRLSQEIVTKVASDNRLSCALIILLKLSSNTLLTCLLQIVYFLLLTIYSVDFHALCRHITRRKRTRSVNQIDDF